MHAQHFYVHSTFHVCNSQLSILSYELRVIHFISSSVFRVKGFSFHNHVVIRKHYNSSLDKALMLYLSLLSCPLHIIIATNTMPHTKIDRNTMNQEMQKTSDHNTVGVGIHRWPQQCRWLHVTQKMQNTPNSQFQALILLFHFILLLRKRRIERIFPSVLVDFCSPDSKQQTRACLVCVLYAAHHRTLPQLTWEEEQPL